MQLQTLLLLFTPILAAPLALRQTSSDTENGLANGTACADLTLIYARGTFETGNVGNLVGPDFVRELRDAIAPATFAAQGVSYPGTVDGFFAGGDAGGSRLTAQLVEQARTQCPGTKIVLGGYSQGAQLVHNGAGMLSADGAAAINSVVLFGDPKNGQPVGSIPASKVKTFCHDGDSICLGQPFIQQPHLNYGQDTPAAAAFIAEKAGF